jgi:hypothetical protein
LASASVFLKNPHTGQLREAPVGFSWTVLFFGPFPALFRQDWFGFLIILLCALVTFGLSGLVFMFIYNGMYLRSLIRNGYAATGSSSDLDLIQQRLGMQIPRLPPS